MTKAEEAEKAWRYGFRGDFQLLIAFSIKLNSGLSIKVQHIMV